MVDELPFTTMLIPSIDLLGANCKESPVVPSPTWVIFQVPVLSVRPDHLRGEKPVLELYLLSLK